MYWPYPVVLWLHGSTRARKSTVSTKVASILTLHLSWLCVWAQKQAACCYSCTFSWLYYSSPLFPREEKSAGGWAIAVELLLTAWQEKETSSTLHLSLSLSIWNVDCCGWCPEDDLHLFLKKDFIKGQAKPSNGRLRIEIQIYYNHGESLFRFKSKRGVQVISHRMLSDLHSWALSITSFFSWTVITEHEPNRERRAAREIPTCVAPFSPYIGPPTIPTWLNYT